MIELAHRIFLIGLYLLGATACVWLANALIYAVYTTWANWFALKRQFSNTSFRDSLYDFSENIKDDDLTKSWGHDEGTTLTGHIDLGNGDAVKLTPEAIEWLKSQLEAFNIGPRENAKFHITDGGVVSPTQGPSIKPPTPRPKGDVEENNE